MNIPNKIYLYTENNVVLDNDWLYVAPKECESFEYMRTDAFIKKAEEYFMEHFDYKSNYGYVTSDDYASMKDFIEDFKTYIKRE